MLLPNSRSVKDNLDYIYKTIYIKSCFATNFLSYALHKGELKQDFEMTDTQITSFTKQCPSCPC